MQTTAITDPTTTFIAWVAISLVAGTLIIRLAEALTNGIEFDGWGSAIAAVVVVGFGNWGLGLALATLKLPDAVWVTAGFTYISTICSLVLAAFIAPGMRTDGPLGVLVAALFLTILSYITPALATLAVGLL
jgi:uncharacterized membrane protein YvlD (DUF360 family)